MKNILLIIFLGLILSKEKINFREYFPVDNFIKPQIYVYNSDGELSFEEFESIPLVNKDTLVIARFYDSSFNSNVCEYWITDKNSRELIAVKDPTENDVISVEIKKKYVQNYKFSKQNLHI